MIQEAYGEDALSRTRVFQWHKNFWEGRDDVHDKQRVGPPSTSHTDTNVQKMRDVLNSDRRLSIRAIADEVGIDKMTVHNIIKNDLGMRKICAKLVPKHLTDEQKERRVSVPSEIQTVEGNVATASLQPGYGTTGLLSVPQDQETLKGTRFGTLENVQRATTRALDSIEVADFQGAFGDWKIRYQRVIDSNGDYFEDF